MKKNIYRYLMGIAAIIAVFLLGSIINIKNDVWYLIGTIAVSALISLGFYLGTEPKGRYLREEDSEEEEDA